MRAGVLTGARVALLTGPAVLAFFAGGYFDGPRAVAGLVAWLLAAVALIAVPDALRVGRGGIVAIVGLAFLAGWTLLSIVWAPIAGSAYHAGQIVILYLGTLLAAAALLRDRGGERIAEPAVALGVLIVIGYGISGRLLPGLLHFQRSVSAQGRLEQPLTYWNAMGELAALGVVLCARLAGDSTRPRWLRLGAMPATAIIGMGLYLSFSRGALFACAAGLIALILFAPTAEQCRALLVALVVGVLASGAAAPFHSVTALAGDRATREREGAISLALLVVIMVAGTIAQSWLMRHERPRRLALPRSAPVLATAVICVGLALAIVVGAKEHATSPLSGGATRLVTLQSNRYDYWRVAVHAFRDEPIRGVGAGGWAVYWLRYRPINEFAQDAHSLPLQTLAELGIVGVAFLIMFLGGVGLAARDALRSAPALAAGPAAVFVGWLAHQPLDWDWQMPAVTLVAVVLAGALIGLTRPQRSAAPRG
jgi:O-Antigen ligase